MKNMVQLDSRIRLCIRDSLFRLAKSAVQRHYTSDTSSTNTCSNSKDENEGLPKDDHFADNRLVISSNIFPQSSFALPYFPMAPPTAAHINFSLKI